MKAAATLLLLFYLPLSAKGEFMLPKCANPGDGAKGRVVVHYKISESCQPSEAKFDDPQPPQSLQSATLCLAQWAPPLTLPANLNAMTEEEYRKLQTQEREKHPERYHQRSINVVLQDGSSAQITCYFDKAWHRTVTEIFQGKHRHTFSDFGSLPVQTKELSFEARRP